MLSLQERMVGQLREKQLELTAMRLRLEAQKAKRVQVLAARQQRALLQRTMAAWCEAVASPAHAVSAFAERQFEARRLRRIVLGWHGVSARRQWLLRIEQGLSQRRQRDRKRACLLAIRVRARGPMIVPDALSRMPQTCAVSLEILASLCRAATPAPLMQRGGCRRTMQARLPVIVATRGSLHIRARSACPYPCRTTRKRGARTSRGA